MTAPFSARAWVSRWEDAGGGWAMVGTKLAFLLPENQDELDPMMSQIVGHPDRLAAVRQYVAGRP